MPRLKPDYRDIEQNTLQNKYYRRVLYTVPNKMQLVLMSLKPHEDIPLETHPHTAQFIRIESGKGRAIVHDIVYELLDGDTIIVPPNTPHYVKNTSRTKDLKLYSIYTPPEHPPRRLNKIQPKHT